MQIPVKGGHLQMFSGANADQRFARDDIGDDLILRERDLHTQVPVPMRLDQDEPINPLPPTEDDDDDKEYGRDNRSEGQPKAPGFGF